MNGPAPAGGDTAANLGLGLLGAAALSALALRAAADAACWATGKDAPTGGLAAAAGVLARPGDPGAAFGVTGLSPVAYWAAFAAIAAAAAATTAWAWLAFRRHGRRAGNDPHRTPGTATRDDVKRHASARALTRRGAALRPSVAKPAPAQVGYLLGRAHGTPVWASVEDSMLVLGPPRSGK
ncbi:MAG: hypothetical protein LBK95_21245, partial [Bifidobacteriaceae bacterium]|nr:hypothetical protein [Bifidobacteriaceae bacterium]